MLWLMIIGAILWILFSRSEKTYRQRGLYLLTLAVSSYLALSSAGVVRRLYLSPKQEAVEEAVDSFFGMGGPFDQMMVAVFLLVSVLLIVMLFFFYREDNLIRFMFITSLQVIFIAALSLIYHVFREENLAVGGLWMLVLAGGGFLLVYSRKLSGKTLRQFVLLFVRSAFK